jgi:hypothetical protein
MRTVSRLWTATPALGLALGCSTTHLATQWVNPAEAQKPVRRLLVAAPSAQSAADRINFERRLSEELRSESNTKVTSLFELVPELGEMSEGELKEVLDNGQFDGALVVRWLDRRQKLEVTSNPTSFGYGLWFRSYFFAERDRLRTYEVVSLETNLHRVPSFDLAWSGRTETVDVDAPEDLAEDLGDVVSEALLDAGLLLPTK